MNLISWEDEMKRWKTSLSSREHGDGEHPRKAAVAKLKNFFQQLQACERDTPTKVITLFSASRDVSRKL